MSLPLSPAQTIRAAQVELARRARAKLAPVVLWAGLDESPETLAVRCAHVPRNRRLLVAVPHGYPMPEHAQAVEFTPKLFRLLHPDASSRYRVASGGRGSGKSHGFAAAIVLRMLTSRRRVLAAREIQRSLRESVHHLLTEKIDQLGMAACFDITERDIACRTTGAEVIYTGLMTNVQQIKSLEGVQLVWIEEAESVSARSLEVLTPTIRAAGSEIWLSMNPDDPEAPAQAFIDGTRPDTRHEHVTYADNPWFPPELESERLYLRSVDEDAYQHVWEGKCRQASDAQILKGKYFVEEFGTPWGADGPYLGLDFGFSQDPTAAVKCYVADRTLLVEYEAYQIGCDIDRTPALLDQIPGARQYAMRADCARPESISYLSRSGFPKIQAVTKWSGSVEDGVAHLRSYDRIVIHPRCTRTIEEARLYSYKVDRLSGDVMPDIVDAHNHLMDALRYALQPLIRKAGEWSWAGA